MTPIKKLGPLSLLLIFVLLPACSDMDDAVVPEAPQDEQPTLDLDYFAYLELQKNAPTYTYEVALEGEIDLTTGGTVTGRPASWPDTASDFSYTILPDAVDRASLADPDASTVHVKVWVPVYESTFPDPDYSMPMILEPDGLAYLAGQHATVELSYHPELVPSTVDSGYAVFCIDEMLPTDISVGVVSTAGGQVDYSTRIRASIAHHSRWVVDKTDNGDEGD